jgi:hypothetical protein
MTRKFPFIEYTLKFCIAGIFIPGFSAIVLLGLQMIIESLGVECSKSWNVVWTITILGAILLPFLFIVRFKRKLRLKIYPTINEVITFNILEYIFLQSALATYFSNASTLCYGRDGQNGLEFVFTAWMGLPILVVLSSLFTYLGEKQIEDIEHPDQVP